MRRRNQPDVDRLPSFCRFLVHRCNQLGISQRGLAASLGWSVARASRLFRGEVAPTEEVIARLAALLELPVGNLQLLRVLDVRGPVEGTVPHWRNLFASGGSRLLLAGATLASGIYALREIPLGNRSLLVSIVEPWSSALVDFEFTTDGGESGWMRDAWSLTAKTVISAGRRSAGRCRLWTRAGLRAHPGAATDEGHIVANDWIALESFVPSGSGGLCVHFIGDEGWRRAVQPLLDRLASDEARPDETLIWDNSWGHDDARFERLRARFEAAGAGPRTDEILQVIYPLDRC